MELIRLSLCILLFALFSWQTYQSVSKYAKKDVTMTTKDSYPETMAFPSISFCPRAQVNTDVTTLKPFGYFKMPSIILAYKQGNNSVEIAAEDGQLTHWKRDISLTPNKRLLLECLTYSSDQRVAPGLETSELNVYLDDSGLFNLLIYIHEKTQDALVNIPLFGSVPFHVPPSESLRPDSIAKRTYIVTVKKIKKMSNDYLPCVEKDEMNHDTLMSCFNSKFEREFQCQLPWKPPGNMSQVCSTSNQFSEYINRFIALHDFSPRDLYQHVGCIYKCDFNVYSVRLLSRAFPKRTAELRKINLPGSTAFKNMTAALRFFLSPEGTTVMAEVLAYDGYDLIGNIGGFLGLFLGASCLSIYDDIKKMRATIKKRFFG